MDKKDCHVWTTSQFVMVWFEPYKCKPKTESSLSENQCIIDL